MWIRQENLDDYKIVKEIIQKKEEFITFFMAFSNFYYNLETVPGFLSKNCKNWYSFFSMYLNLGNLWIWANHMIESEQPFSMKGFESAKIIV